MNIGTLIKMERQQQQIKQTVLAKGICSPSYLSKIENGTATPSDAIIKLLLERLNIPEEQYLRGNFDIKLTELIQDFQYVIERHDTQKAKMLEQALQQHLCLIQPIYPVYSSLLIMYTRILLFLFSTTKQVREQRIRLSKLSSEMTHRQLFHFYLLEGLIEFEERCFPAALQAFQKAKIVGEQPIAAWERAHCHELLAHAALKDHRGTLAIHYAKKALSYYNVKMIPLRSIECSLIVGMAQKQVGQIKEAIYTFEQTKDKLNVLKNERLLATIEYQLGACYTRQNEFEPAKHYLTLSFERTKEPADQICIIIAFIKLYSKMNEYQQAYNWLEKGKSNIIYLTENLRPWYTYILSIYRAILYNTQRLIPIFESALAYFEEKRNDYACAALCHLLGQKLAERKDFEKAAYFFQKGFSYYMQHQQMTSWEDLC